MYISARLVLLGLGFLAHLLTMLSVQSSRMNAHELTFDFQSKLTSCQNPLQREKLSNLVHTIKTLLSRLFMIETNSISQSSSQPS